MNQVSRPTGLIKPFNLDTEEYNTMYNGPLPEKLQAILITNREIGVETLYESVMELMENDPVENENTEKANISEESRRNQTEVLNPRVCGLKCDIDLICFDRMSPREFSSDPGIVLPFMEDGIDIQLVFQEKDFKRSYGIVEGWVYAMDLFDHLCATTGSYESKVHLPIERDPETAECFRVVVHDIYRRRWGYMNRQLVNYRNKLLVMAIAITYGKDPILAYDRFIDANGKSYLEFADLCW